jgi:nucleoside-diphosphate-sugar epimerase
MIYLLGHKGFLGSAIENYLKENKLEYEGIDRENYDEFTSTSCDIFINANGNSKKWLAEKDPAADFQMNVAATLKTIFDFKIGKYVFISTIDVYNDTQNTENNSEDATIVQDRLSNYGFHKYTAEQIVRKYCKKWIILRFGGLVGAGLKKNPVFDILKTGNIFVSSESRYQYLNTRDAAAIVGKLLELENEVINVCGDGTISISEAANHAGVKLDENEKKKDFYDVNIEKLKSLVHVPKTKDTVFRFIDDVRNRKVEI